MGALDDVSGEEKECSSSTDALNISVSSDTELVLYTESLDEPFLQNDEWWHEVFNIDQDCQDSSETSDQYPFSATESSQGIIFSDEGLSFSEKTSIDVAMDEETWREIDSEIDRFYQKLSDTSGRVSIYT